MGGKLVENKVKEKEINMNYYVTISKVEFKYTKGNNHFDIVI